MVADFGADNEIDGSSIGKKTTNIYKQNSILNADYIISEFVVNPYRQKKTQKRKQILSKTVKQKTKINRGSGKINYNTEINRDEGKENNVKNKTIRRAIRSRTKHTENYDQLSFRISEFKKSLI